MRKKILLFIYFFFFVNQMFAFSQEILFTDMEAFDQIKKPNFPLNESNKEMLKAGVESVIDINLEDCIKFALGNNPRIQAAMQDVFASDTRIKQVWSSFFPQVGWQTGYTRIRQLQLSDVFRENLVFNYFVLGQISASQMLYDFGVTQNQVTIRKLDNKGYKITLTKTINEVLCDVKTSYYYFQYALEARKVANEMTEKYTAFYNQAKAFYVVGLKPKIDLTIAEVNLSNSKINLIQAENSVGIAMAKLNNAMGLVYSNKYSLKDFLKYSECDINLEEAIEIAEKSRPEFQLADVKIEEARQNIKLAQKSYFPQLTIEGQYQVGGREPTSNYGYNFGGYLNFPTINVMLIRNEIKEAKSILEKEKALAKSSKNNIYYEVQEAFLTLDEKKKRIPVAYIGLKQAKENYELSYGRYKVGIGDPIELKEAQTEYQNSKLMYYQTLYNYNVAKANLEKSVGKNIISNSVQLDKSYIKEKS